MPRTIPPLSPRQRVLHVGPDHCAAIVGRVLVVVVKDDPNDGVIDQVKSWLATLRATTVGSTAFLVVLSPDTPPPPDLHRVRIRQVLEELGTTVTVGAVVVQGSGFLAATLRSILTLLITAARLGYPVKVLGSLAEAAEWLMARLDGGNAIGQTMLVQKVEYLKEDYFANRLETD
jgi:hypothetical protein